jgi:hypothetical protein
MKVTEEKAWAAWNKIQEDGPDLDFESFWEILKEVVDHSTSKAEPIITDEMVEKAAAKWVEISGGVVDAEDRICIRAALEAVASNISFTGKE